jgi:hypothetical protein
MSNDTASLAARRARLIEQCAAQRACLAEEISGLRAPFTLDTLRASLGASNKLLLAAGGIALGLAVTRPRRLLGLASRGAALLGAARRFLPLLSR